MGTTRGSWSGAHCGGLVSLGPDMAPVKLRRAALLLLGSGHTCWCAAFAGERTKNAPTTAAKEMIAAVMKAD